MIHSATLADIPAVLDMLAKHHAEKAFPWSFNPVQLDHTVRSAIAAPDSQILVGDGCLLIMSYVDSPFGAPRFVYEHILRASKPGQFDALLDHFEDWGRMHGCKRAILSCTEKPDVFARKYRRRGYAPAENLFAKDL